MPQLLMPNIAGTAMQGFQQGQQMQANRLIGQAMQAPDQRQQLLGQAGSIDPRMALTSGSMMDAQAAQQQQMQQDQQKQQLAQQQAVMKKVGGAARYMLAAVQTKNPAQIQGAWQSVAPYLTQLTGKQAPAQFDPVMLPMMYQVIAQTSDAFPDDSKLQIAPAGSTVLRGGSPIYSNPTQAKIVNGMAVSQGPNGELVASPIPINGAGAPAQAAQGAGASPQNAPSSPGFQGSATSPSGNSVSFNFPPGTPPEVIAAAQASAVANGDLAPGQQVGATAGAQQSAPQGSAQPQTLAQVVAAQKAGAGSDVIRQRAQQVAELKARGVQMTPEDEQTYLTTGKVGSNFQGGSSATLFGDPSKTGADYLATIPQGNREIVQGLLNGTTKMPTGTTLKSPLWQSVLASVQHADPTWNEAAFSQYAQARRNFTTGTGGRQINTINTALQHMQKLTDVVNAMNNGDFTALNFLSNEGANAFSHGQLANFNAIISQVATEMAAVYKGGNAAPTDQEIQHFRQALSPSLGHAKQVEVLRDWTDLLTGKLNSLAEQYQDSMSPLSQPITIIKPEARQAFNSIEQLNAKLGGGSPAQVPAQPTVYAPGGGVQQPRQPTGAPAIAPGTIEQGYRFKGGDPSNQANWEPVQ
jgi:hypothetical protein